MPAQTGKLGATALKVFGRFTEECPPSGDCSFDRPSPATAPVRGRASIIRSSPREPVTGLNLD